jgi:hypothetical protein
MLHLFKNLQIFGEGGDGAAAPGPGPEAGAGVVAPDAGEHAQKPGRKAKAPQWEFGQPTEEAVSSAAQQPAEQAQPQESWEDVKKRFKDEYGRDVQAAIQGRFKNAKATEVSLAELTKLVAPLIEQRYGIKAGEDGSIDLKALQQKVDADDDLIAEEAAELGLSTEFYRAKRASEQKVKELEAELARRDHDARMAASFQKHQQQAEAARQFYPNLDLLKEMENPMFTRLLANDVDVQTAYEVVHRNEVMGGMMGFAAHKAATALSNSIQANAARPSENGLGRQSAANVTRILDPRQLTREQRKELRRQVHAGKKIVW